MDSNDNQSHSASKTNRKTIIERNLTTTKTSSEIIDVDEDDGVDTNTRVDPFIMRNKRKVDTTTNVRGIQRAKREKVSDTSLPLTNRFAVFNSNGAQSSNSIGVQWATGDASNQVAAKKPKRPPPIVITNNNYMTVKDILKGLGLQDYSIKITNIGVKIQCDSHESTKKIADHLKTETIEHFSHKDRDTKIFRAVMYGLPRSDIPEIIDDLKKFNVTPIEVTELKSNNPDPNNAIYVVNFNRADVSMSTLNNIRAVLHVRIR